MLPIWQHLLGLTEH